MDARRALMLALTTALIATTATASAHAAATPRIVGGTPAASMPPWMTQVWTVQGRQMGLCGGQLITSRWVLTAAHCATAQRTGAPLPIGNFNLRVGNPIADTPPDEEFAVPDIDKVVVNPLYTPDHTPGDLALLHLPAPVNVVPVALGATTDVVTGARPDALGWGVINRRGDTSVNLLTVPQPIVDPGACNFYGADFDAGSMICAGGLNGQDSCNGDSGGPLALNATSPIALLLGTVDYGSDKCGDGTPAVYQRLTDGAAAQWVRSIISLPQIGIGDRPVKGLPTPLSASSAWPDATFSWDLDGNGSFGDATGASIRPNISSPRVVTLSATSPTLKETAIARVTIDPVNPFTVTTRSTATEGGLVTLKLTPNGSSGELLISTTGMSRQKRTVRVNGPRTIRLRLPKDKSFHSKSRKLTINLRSTGTLRLIKTRLVVSVKDKR